MGVLYIAISYLFRIINYAILIYCIGSWFVRPGTRLFSYWQKLGYYLDPLFRPARAILSKLNLFKIPIDFTPWLTVILLEIIYSVLTKILLF